MYTFIHISNVCFFYLTHSCFYNIAKDPPASDPRAHQAELGYTILQGPYEGQVDINAELSSITDSVKSSGRASAATFWDVNSVFNRLHDGHVTLPQFRNDSLLTPASLFYIPERCQNGSVTGRHEFTTGSDGDLILKMFWKYENKTEEEESIVKSLNGMDVYSFFSEVSNSPSINLSYQSIGARFNALLQIYRMYHQSTISAFNDKYGTGVYLWMFFILPLNSRPSNVYPDSIRVVYEDGDEEIYQSGTTSLAMAALHTNESSTDGLMMGLNRTVAEEILNRPGDIYESYDGDECTVDQSNDISPQLRSGANSESVSSYFDADHILFDPNSGGAMAAGKIEDEYAVLKVEDFRINTDQLVAVWKMLSSQAKESGVNKLIIDISNNGGGIGSSASTLAQLMYPSVEYEYFRKSWDFVISKPMEVYNNTVVPIYEEILNTINALNESDYQGFIDTLTEEQFISINEALCSIQTICNGIECAGDDPTSCFKACDSVDGLKSVIQTFETYRTPSFLKNVAQTLYNLINTINPGRVRPTADLSDVDLNGYRTVNRGGVLTNVSLPFTGDPIEYYYQAVASSYQTLHKFDEYIIVSNGVSGSATALFASLVNQLWKNRDITLVKSSLVSVSYGGLNTTEGDVMMAGFPAGVQNVHLEDPLLAAGILYIFNTLLEGDSTFSPVISSALSEYANVLPTPPYFANTLPKLPVLNYYSTLMGEGALPLQYVKMPTDKHLPFYYTQTTIDDAGDLPELYDKASKLFTSSINNSDFNKTSDDDDSSNGTDTVSSSFGDKEESSNAGIVSDQSSSTLTLHRCNELVVLLAAAVGYMFV